MNAPSTETASSWSWVSSTTASKRPTEKISRSSGELAMPPGTNGAMTPGSGREPITLSTAILRGSGVSSARGLASRLSRNSRAMYGHDGRASRSSRRKTTTSLYVAIVFMSLRRSARARARSSPPRARSRARSAPPGLPSAHRGSPPRAMPGPSSPRRKAGLESSQKSRERLGEVEKSHEDAQLSPCARPVGNWKGRASRREARADQRKQRCDHEEHEPQEQWSPEQAEEREATERDDHEHPLRRSDERPERAGRRLIKRLKGSASPGAVIDAAAAEPDETLAVHAARPSHMAGAVVLLRPLALEHRLRSAVAPLLPPVGAN